MLIWSGNADVWQSILMERNNIVHKRKAEELEMENAKAKRRKEIEDVMTMACWRLRRLGGHSGGLGDYGIR